MKLWAETLLIFQWQIEKFWQEKEIDSAFGLIQLLGLPIIENNESQYKSTTVKRQCAILMTNKLLLATLFINLTKKLENK